MIIYRLCPLDIFLALTTLNLLWLLEKYCPDYIEDGKLYIEQKGKVTRVFKIEINHISGKARR